METPEVEVWLTGNRIVIAAWRGGTLPSRLAEFVTILDFGGYRACFLDNHDHNAFMT